jgi:vancomycin resistance protein YoaR
MSKFRTLSEGVLAATLIVVLGYIWLNYEFADHVPPRARVGLFVVGGLKESQVLYAMNAYEREFAQTKATIAFRGAESTRTFQELGIELRKEETAKRIHTMAKRGLRLERVQIIPAISFHDEVALKALQEDFKDHMVIPQNATLSLDTNRVIRTLSARNGEHIDMLSLDRDIEDAFSQIPLQKISASAVRAVPPVNPAEIEATRIFAESILRSGFHFTSFERTFDVPGNVAADMMRFTSDATPKVQFDENKLREYIVKHIAPQVQQDPVNARFQVQDGKVTQFAMPQDGRTANVDETVLAVENALALRSQTSEVVVQIARPLIADTGDSEKLGITKLLARGETDFVGSPKNRTINIHVGTARYNGILIAPNEEFSFNAFLGPVTKEAGFAPELVIKNHVTTPEFGGGLCQVSTTAFRAAVYAGMEITSRRNHAYAVRYYGTPGFDATIYPPYTDFRFLNNTPGYILIQTKIEGTKLSFEFWGTDDNRSVVVDGPHPYNKKPDGAVKSVLKQTVTKDGQTLVEDTFYSNYKSPNLFPHT